jgi:ABC-2 type transport system permease protein
MIAFWGNIKKELLLLMRDKSGMAFLFLMPIVLVLLMTLLQDKTIKKLQVERMNIAVINRDNGIVGEAIVEGLKEMEIFNVYQSYQGDSMTLELAHQGIENGDFHLGVLIPEKTTRATKRIISNELRKQLPAPGSRVLADSLLKDVALQIFFDPVIQASLRSAMKSAIEQLLADVRTMIVFNSYKSALEKLTGRTNTDDFPIRKFKVEEAPMITAENAVIPSATQHNVPSWTVFAIFFMVIPLATQIIGEREEGSIIRLKMASTPFFIPYLARILVYAVLSVFQALVLLLIGMYLIPLLGVSALDIHGNYSDFLLFTLFIGLAASAYGIAVGSIAHTHHQASVFGSISVVLLAAIGGIWVPTYLMPEAMLAMAKLSPLNWALEGYYAIVLKGSQIGDLGIPILKLLLFFIGALSVAVIFGKRKNI